MKTTQKSSMFKLTLSKFKKRRVNFHSTLNSNAQHSKQLDINVRGCGHGGPEVCRRLIASLTYSSLYKLLWQIPLPGKLERVTRLWCSPSHGHAPTYFVTTVTYSWDWPHGTTVIPYIPFYHQLIGNRPARLRTTRVPAIAISPSLGDSIHWNTCSTL